MDNEDGTMGVMYAAANSGDDGPDGSRIEGGDLVARVESSIVPGFQFPVIDLDAPPRWAIPVDQRPPTPLIHVPGLFGFEDVFVKYECDPASNPTQTFKDRLAERAIIDFVEGGRPVFRERRAQASSKLPIYNIASITYGNTGLAFALAVYEYNQRIKQLTGVDQDVVRFIAFVPKQARGFKSLDQRVMGPSTNGLSVSGSDYLDFMRALGAEIVEIDLTARTASGKQIIYDSRKLRREAQRAGVLLRGRTKKPKFLNVTDGIMLPEKVPAYRRVMVEALQQLRATYHIDNPDYVLAPFGAGVLCEETKDVCGRSSGRPTVIPVSTGYPHSIAQMLYGPIWVDVKAIREDGKGRTKFKDRKDEDQYWVYGIEDGDIRTTMRACARHPVLSDKPAEPSGISSLVYLKHNMRRQFRRALPDRHSVLAIVTGDGPGYLHQAMGYNHPNETCHETHLRRAA